MKAMGFSRIFRYLILKQAVLGVIRIFNIFVVIVEIFTISIGVYILSSSSPLAAMSYKALHLFVFQ